MTPSLAILLFGQLHLQVSADPPVAQLGDTVVVTIEATHPPGQIATIEKTLQLGAFSEKLRSHSRSGGKEEVDRYELVVVALDLGKHRVPSIPVTLGSTVALTQPIDIEIKGLFSDAQLAGADLLSLAAPDPPPAQVKGFNPAVLIFLGAAVLLLLVITFVLKRAGKETTTERREHHRPAHEIAFEELEALSARSLVQASLEDHYVELSRIMRAFAGAHYGFSSLDLTHGELLSALRSKSDPKLDLDSYDLILKTADNVKFADYQPAAEQAEQALRSAIEVIRRVA